LIAGIRRFVITDEIRSKGAWRFSESKKRHIVASELYREIFERQGRSLLSGYDEILCSKKEFNAGYDYALGIDVLLTLREGGVFTLQEKFLFKDFKTVTVEYMQNPFTGELGDWFTMKAQLYFVGYDRQHIRCAQYRTFDKEIITSQCPECFKPFNFQDWILLNWPAMKLEKNIPWELLSNMRDGARANFKFVPFDKIPVHCIIAISS